MRKYRKGELVGYSDEFMIMSLDEYEEDSYESAQAYETEEEAVEDILNGEVFADVVALVKVCEYYEGTDYELVRKYVYDEDADEYVVIEESDS